VPFSQPQIHYLLLFSRHGKVRLAKWFTPHSAKEATKLTREIVTTVLSRKTKMCNILEWQDRKIVYKRYASLYFAMCIDNDDNELLTLEIIHRYVETLDRYFGNVCELDIVFNFDKVRSASRRGRRCWVGAAAR